MPKISVMIPCYNEEEVLPETSKRLKNKLEELMEKGKIDRNSKIVFVNDGSKDRTWEIVEKLHEEDHIFSGINLSRNRGHQNALLAGLMTAKNYADMVVSMDADLQDDINAVDEMVEKYLNGIDIVYGVRSSRAKDTFFKKATAEGFYKLMNGMGANTVFNHADYRLMSKRALQEFSKYQEINLYLRGVMPLIAYETDCVYYERKERVAGESKYPLKKMLALAWNGITSFSVKPIDFITALGGFLIFLCVIAAVYALVSYCNGHTVPGWTSLILSIWFLGGMQLVAIGMIGQYIGKIYIEVKHRPRYNVETYLNHDNE